MENSKAIQPEQVNSQPKSLILTTDEKKRLVDFFTILIDIDQRNKKERVKNETSYN